MKLLRLKPGHGEVVLAEGDVDVPEQERELIEAFRRELDAGMWAAVPTERARRPPRGGDGAELRGRAARRGAGDLLPARCAAGRRRARSRRRAASAAMWLALSAAAIMAAVLLWELALPRLRAELPRVREALARRRARRRVPEVSYDPGRELRAEQRARELLRSCVNEEEWAMYRDLGFLRVWSPAPAARAPRGTPRGRRTRTCCTRTGRSWRTCRRRGRC